MRWIEQGSDWPSDKVDAKHWSYEKPIRPNAPQVLHADWPQNAIDSFVLAKLEAEGLQPSRAADRARLIRRVYLDLIGLPPTPEQVARLILFLLTPQADWVNGVNLPVDGGRLASQ